MIRTRCVVAALPLLVCLLPLASARADHARKQFGAWTSGCAASTHCTASTRLTAGDKGGYAYQLRISRFQSGVQEIAFLPAAAAPAADSPIAVAVDGKTRSKLAPGTGYRRIGSGNTFVVDPSASDDLLRAMRGARRVTFSYATPGGKAVQADFPLQGFVQAIASAGIRVPMAKAGAAHAAAEPAGKKSSATAGAAPNSTAAANAPVVPQAPVAPVPAPSAVREAERPSAALPGPTLGGIQQVSDTTAPTIIAARKRTKAVLQFACRGNEPSWSLVIDHDTARYLALQGGEPEALPLKGKLRVTGEGRTPDVNWRGKAPDGSVYKVLIQEQACTDTMAEASAGEGRSSFPYRVQLTLPGGKVVQGCCSAGLESAQRPATAQPASLEEAPLANLFGRPAGDWSRFLLELMPAINACVEKTPGESPYVTKAWPMNRGLVGVRTRNLVAGWFDCVAQYDGGSIERFEAVTADAAPIPGEGHVLFTPLAHAPLAGNCWRHERVVDLSGNALGWLSTNGC